ncbi:VOC family protein [Seleniivibrio sp.]|uniref:VOC family protein n=1 Tax=Seleniivibrio sp. TaxID=2898801 RepID=UPI0025D98CDE|nr:VOC family protein [Seleniivibrio sp.]MCD8553325.1 VOC family protein [Seleniivibrio sp.]
MIKYGGMAVMAEDVRVSLAFYRDILGLELMMDNGDEHVMFKCGVALWKRDAAHKLIFGSVCDGSSTMFELFFESDSINEDYERLSVAAKVVNPLEEQPWGQLTFRIADPDGHLIEIGEKLSDSIKRMRTSGMTDDEISIRTHVGKDMLDSL